MGHFPPAMVQYCCWVVEAHGRAQSSAAVVAMPGFRWWFGLESGDGDKGGSTSAGAATGATEPDYETDLESGTGSSSEETEEEKEMEEIEEEEEEGGGQEVDAEQAEQAEQAVAAAAEKAAKAAASAEFFAQVRASRL